MGFFSATRSLERPDMMQIRARCKGDLENLKAHCKLTGKILETPMADYRWRIICRPETFTRVATQLAEEIDYSNFKNSIRPDQKNKPLFAVWSAMQRFQEAQQRPSPGDWLFDDEPEEEQEAVKRHHSKLGLRYSR